MSLNEIRDGFAARLRQQINEGVEQLLRRWTVPHLGHLEKIRKVIDEQTSPMRDRYTCFECNETLILKHSQTMVGTEIHWSVTPEVLKAGENPDRNPDILSGSEGGRGEEGVSGQTVWWHPDTSTSWRRAETGAPLVGNPKPAEHVKSRLTYGGTIVVEVSDEESAERAARELERIAGEIRRGTWRPDYVDEAAPAPTREQVDFLLGKGRKRWMGE